MALSRPHLRAKPDLPPPSNRTLLQSWGALPPRTRLIISSGICVFALTGLMISDYLEKTALDVKLEKAQREHDLAASKNQ
ncbi:hypothetical protein CVT26_014179 [Gymnopilus dilepis]|uniref:Uncharacterized protein n=1 Tax=Gymnopilus dilepis TaxID=231916 RepID=A0A409VU27_9AGAR|nr:hypothetical protein CVT26_014179 [Gymnopilus dilepis]